MDETTAAARPPHLWAKWLAGLAVVLLALVLLVVFFPWDWLRGPLNRYVSERTGRHFEITRRLDVKLGRTTRVLADGIEFANPDWAADPYLVKAEAAEVDVRLWPLLQGRIDLPLISLHKPALSLQVEPDGRRSWAMGRDTSDPRYVPNIGSLVVDEGTVHYIAPAHGADIRSDFAIDGGSANNQMPLSYKAKGTWKKEPFTAQGRTGNVLNLSELLQQPFPLEVNATAAHTTLRASGSIGNLSRLDGADASFSLQGANLSELYKLLGVVLPESPRYALRGRLTKQGDVWHVAQINGTLGRSDLSGDLAFDRSHKVPLLSGKLHSKAVDFDDLAPLVGLPEQRSSAAALPKAGATAPAARPAQAAVSTRRPPADASHKVLPTATLDLARLKAMNADVQYSAAEVVNVKLLPLDRVTVHVRLNAGVLQLDPMDLGVAGGRLAGRLRIDGNSDPATAEVKLDVTALDISKLFPGVQTARTSFGKMHGAVELRGRGNSTAQMLGTSSGNVAMLMGKGEISNLLMAVAGLDGAEIIQLLLAGDKNVQLRCAAVAFNVNNGLMSSRALLLDTSDTVIYGDGRISLANEALDLTLRPYPKDPSFLSMRSPLKVGGSFASPRAGPDKGALAARAGVALGLAAINPLLALAATIETGPGKDANCGQILREAASPAAAGRAAAGRAAAAGPPDPAKPAKPDGPPVAAPAKKGDNPVRKTGPWTPEQLYKQ